MSTPGGDAGHLLVVEDDPDEAELVQRALSRHRFIVTVVGDGPACLAEVERRPYAGVLLDYSLPRMTGLEALARLRDRYGDRLPVVMVTAQGDERVAAEAIDAGATDYVVKTSGYLTALPTVVHKALRQHAIARESERRRREANVIAEVARTINGTLDLDTLLQRIATAARDICQSDLAAVALREADGDRATLTHMLGMEPPPGPRLVVRRGQGLGGGVLEHGRPLRTDDYRADVRADGRYVAVLERLGIVSTLVVPIVADARVEGLLYAANRTCRPFDATDETALTRLADHAAIALRNVRLFAREQAARAEAQASERRFRHLVQGLDAVVWEGEATTGRFTFVSDAVESVLGEPAAAWLADPGFWQSRVHPDDLAPALAARRAAMTAGTDYSVEYRLHGAGQRLVWVRDRVRVERDEAGRPAQLRGVMIDITAQRDAADALRLSEQQLRHAQKMEAIGRLAGGVAHDFNNLLAVVLGHAALLATRAPDEPTRAIAEKISHAAERGASLTRHLLAFSRKQVLQPRAMDVNGLVSQVTTMLRRLIPASIHLETVLGSDIGAVRVDAGLMDQVLVNLAVNARDAMPDGGRITIRTGRVDVTSPDDGSPGARAYAVIEVSDTGSGIPDAIRHRIFDPFFTTKAPGKGSGLGLAMVYGIVEEHGGHIVVDSEVGRGTRLAIHLPEIDGPAAERSAGTGDAAGGGHETVLLVEDEPDVRALVAELLAAGGYTVIPARDGVEALDRLARHAGHVDLLLTDVVMPEMGGPELVARVRAQRPSVSVIYISGYLDGFGPLAADATMLMKPFPPGELLRTVRSVLDRTPAARSAATG